MFLGSDVEYCINYGFNSHDRHVTDLALLVYEYLSHFQINCLDVHSVTFFRVNVIT